MKKITYCMKRLATEYKVMYKPDGRTLMLDTIRIAGTAAVAAVVLKVVDTGFAGAPGGIAVNMPGHWPRFFYT